MEVSVPNVPGRINNGPEDFVLKSLDYSKVARFLHVYMAYRFRSHYKYVIKHRGGYPKFPRICS